jgi:hypothetical protein
VHETAYHHAEGTERLDMPSEAAAGDGDEATEHDGLLRFAGSLTLNALLQPDDDVPAALRDAMRTAYRLAARALQPQRRPVASESSMAGQPMPSLYTEGFDAEQIWMQINLLAAAVYKASRCDPALMVTLLLPCCDSCEPCARSADRILQGG